MKTTLTIATMLLTLVLSKCPNDGGLAQHARDTAAALNGAIVDAQKQNQASCNENNSQPKCIIINKAVDGQNALVTAVEAYCGWSTANPPINLNGQCVPVATAADGLKTAIANADLFIVEIKGVVK